MSKVQPSTDAEWQAEHDADTLMQYHAIKKDRKRCKAARAVLKAKIAAQKQAIKATG